MVTDKTYPVFDGHNDALMAYFLPKHGQRDFLKASDLGHIDLVRASKGGLGAGFFAIFIPRQGRAPGPSKGLPQPGDPAFLPLDPAYAADTAQKAIHFFRDLERRSQGRLVGVRTVEDITTHPKSLCAVLHLEGAEPIHASLDNLDAFYALGVRSIGIVWSRENAFGHGVHFGFPGNPDSGPGLKAAGKDLVRACNGLGIMIDLSHLTEKGFWDVAKISDAPLVATHSCVHAISPSPRNLTDRQIDAIGQSSGMIGINFCTAFLRPDGARNGNTPLSLMVEHIRYIADRIGIDHVGLGSDFDGAFIPEAIGDVTGLPGLLEALNQAGFEESAIEKIAFKNWVRVLDATWKNRD